ncbi:hypothetical protein D3C73_1267850 [compost metagenome]
MPGHRVGALRTTVLAYQVQAAVDAGGGAGGSDNIAVIYVQHILVYRHLGISSQKIGHPLPVGGCRTAVE